MKKFNFNEEILIPGRYHLVHKLKHIKDDLWQLEVDKNSGYSYRLIAFEGESKVGNFVAALDPEGGPFLSVGDQINDYVIKSISNDGVFELIKNNKNEES